MVDANVLIVSGQTLEGNAFSIIHCSLLASPWQSTLNPKRENDLHCNSFKSSPHTFTAQASLAAGGGYGNEADTSVNPTYQFFFVANNTISTAQYIPLIQYANPINLYPFVTTLPRTNSVMMLAGNTTAFYQ